MPSSVCTRTRNASCVPSARPVSISPTRRTIGSTAVIVILGAPLVELIWLATVHLLDAAKRLRRDRGRRTLPAARRRVRRRGDSPVVLGGGSRRGLARSRAGARSRPGRARDRSERGRGGYCC